jgi:hypothetical protein
LWWSVLLVEETEVVVYPITIWSRPRRLPKIKRTKGQTIIMIYKILQTDHHNIAAILLKVALSTINLINSNHTVPSTKPGTMEYSITIWKSKIKFCLQLSGFMHKCIWFIVLNATFSNIAAISWQPVLVVGKPAYPERTTDHGQATGKLYHLR